jgi:hypothetical protein
MQFIWATPADLNCMGLLDILMEYLLFLKLKEQRYNY